MVNRVNQFARTIAKPIITVPLATLLLSLSTYGIISNSQKTEQEKTPYHKTENVLYGLVGLQAIIAGAASIAYQKKLNQKEQVNTSQYHPPYTEKQK